jgi:hypothetical protein
MTTSPLFYGRPAFEWLDNGVHTITLPLCSYTVKIDRRGVRTQNTSMDGTTEVDYLYQRWHISIDATHIEENSATAGTITMNDFCALQSWALQGKPFTFYPHYANNQARPAWIPKAFVNCYLDSDYDFEWIRSGNAAQRWNFSIAFFTNEYSNA